MTAIRLPDNISELLTLRAEQFVDSAYLLILGRPADPSGREYYGRRLQEGGSGHRIVAELALSDEARFRPAQVAGLSDHMLAYQRRHWPHRLIARLWRVDEFGESKRDRQTRRLLTAADGPAQPTSPERFAFASQDSPRVIEIAKKLRQSIAG